MTVLRRADPGCEHCNARGGFLLAGMPAHAPNEHILNANDGSEFVIDPRGVETADTAGEWWEPVAGVDAGLTYRVLWSMGPPAVRGSHVD